MKYIKLYEEFDDRKPTELTDETTFEMFQGTGVYQVPTDKSESLKKQAKGYLEKKGVKSQHINYFFREEEHQEWPFLAFVYSEMDRKSAIFKWTYSESIDPSDIEISEDDDKRREQKYKKAIKGQISEYFEGHPLKGKTEQERIDEIDQSFAKYLKGSDSKLKPVGIFKWIHNGVKIFSTWDGMHRCWLSKKINEKNPNLNLRLSGYIVENVN